LQVPSEPRSTLLLSRFPLDSRFIEPAHPPRRARFMSSEPTQPFHYGRPYLPLILPLDCPPDSTQATLPSAVIVRKASEKFTAVVHPKRRPLSFFPIPSVSLKVLFFSCPSLTWLTIRISALLFLFTPPPFFTHYSEISSPLPFFGNFMDPLYAFFGRQNFQQIFLLGVPDFEILPTRLFRQETLD